jgi:hypothetical protein
MLDMTMKMKMQLPVVTVIITLPHFHRKACGPCVYGENPARARDVKELTFSHIDPISVVRELVLADVLSKEEFKMQRKLCLALGLIAVSVAPAAVAANYPTQKYDAQYELTTPQGKTTMRMASDGAGHFMTQSTTNGFKSTSLLDYLAGTSTTLIEQGKMAMKTKLPANGGMAADEGSVKSAGGKSIGAKVVNGHPCHGYEYSAAGAKTQTWIGDDCHITVQSTTDSTAGKTVMNLKSIAGAPPADTFKVPAGYKVMAQ